MASPSAFVHDTVQQSPFLDDDGEQALDSHILGGSSDFSRSLELLPKFPKSAVDDVNNHWNGVQDFHRENLFRLEPDLRDPNAHSPSSEGWTKFGAHADEARDGQSPTERDSIKLYKATQAFAAPLESWKNPERGWPDRVLELTSKDEQANADRDNSGADDILSLSGDHGSCELSDNNQHPIGLSTSAEQLPRDHDQSPCAWNGPSSSPGIAAVELNTSGQEVVAIEVDEELDTYELNEDMVRGVSKARGRRRLPTQSSSLTTIQKGIAMRVHKPKHDRRRRKMVTLLES